MKPSSTSGSSSSKRSKSITTSMKTSLKYQFAHHKIDAFVAKLEDLRGTLLLATSLALRAGANSNHEDILAQLKDLRDDKDKAEILNTTKMLEDAIRRRAEPKLDQIQSQVEECLSKIDELRMNVPQICTRENAILNWLDFRQMTWRYDEIPLAYQNTYSWIFKKPNFNQKWDALGKHLARNSTEPYFINGKAGSGKSTLMKFIAQHTETHTALSRWTGKNHQLLMLDFYFWHLGSLLQKNVNGLLRALLHRALTTYPDLIPAVFPKQYQNWKGGVIEDEPSYAELKRAFNLLVVKSAKFLKICAFIDGLDEFESDRESDHRDVAEWLCSLTRHHDHVKVVLSSRPLNVCLNTFRNCPTLKLQDLTSKDMESFIEGRLSSHHIMAALTRRFPLQASKLVSEIRDKAQGVFLWVRLVVRLLVDGLEDGDDFADLEERLRSLPPDMKDLYRRMFARVKAEYRVQAAKIFQLIHTWKATTSDPFTINTLFFAMKHPSDVWTLQNEPIDTPSLELFHERTDALIRSRCCGLLEVHEKPTGITTTFSNKHFFVEYLHRTVAEFLTEQEVWDELCNSTQSEGFDPYVNLMSSTLSMRKANLHYVTVASNPTGINISALMRKAAHLDPKLMKKYLVASRDVAVGYEFVISDSRDPSDISDMQIHWPEDLYNFSKTFKSFERFSDLRDCSSIFSFAACLGLGNFLKAFYTLPPDKVCTFKDIAPVFYALNMWLVPTDEPIEEQISLEDRLSTLLFLLQTYRSSSVASLEQISLHRLHDDVKRELATRLESSRDQDLHSYALFVAIFLVTAESPYQYMQQFQRSSFSPELYPESLLVSETGEDDTSCRLEFFTELGFILQRNDDLSIKEIGRQVEKITRNSEGLERETRYFLVRDCRNMIQDSKILVDQNIEALDNIIQHNDVLSEELQQGKATFTKFKLGLLEDPKLADTLTFNFARPPFMSKSEKVSADVSFTIKPIDRLIELEAGLGKVTEPLSKYAEQNNSAVNSLLLERFRELKQEEEILRKIRDELSGEQRLLSSLDEWVVL